MNKILSIFIFNIWSKCYANYKSWFSAPPETVILEDKEVVLILPLLRDDCNNLDNQSIKETSDGCFGAVIWNEEIKSFFRHGYPLSL